MIAIFGCIILTALSVNGMNIATGEGMILEPLKKWLHKKLTYPVVTYFYGVNKSYYDKVNDVTEWRVRKIYKPLIGCVKCMPSIYGTAICLLMLPFTVQLLYIIPIVILSSSTVATIIHSQYI